MRFSGLTVHTCGQAVALQSGQRIQVLEFAGVMCLGDDTDTFRLDACLDTEGVAGGDESSCARLINESSPGIAVHEFSLGTL